MIKSDVAAQIARATDLTKLKASLAIDAVLQTLTESLRRRMRIELRGFGTFTARPRKTGLGRNPRTGETTQLTPGFTVKFKPGKVLRSLR